MTERAELVYSTDAPASQQQYCSIYTSYINQDQCREKTCIVRLNEQYCTSNRCASPWRLCLACVLQGYRGVDARPNPENGLCGFHQKNGKDARRIDETKSDRFISPVFVVTREATSKPETHLNKEEDAMATSPTAVSGKTWTPFSPEEKAFVRNFAEKRAHDGDGNDWDILAKEHYERFKIKRLPRAFEQLWYRLRKDLPSVPGKTSKTPAQHKRTPAIHPLSNGKPPGSTWEHIEQALQCASKELEERLREQAELTKKIEELRRIEAQLVTVLKAKP